MPTTSQLTSKLNDTGLAFSLEDLAILREIKATHTPNGRSFDVKPLLRVVKDIIIFRDPTVKHDGKDASEDKTPQSHDDPNCILEDVACTINKISREVFSNFSDGVDIHSRTKAILSVLSRFPWEAKLVLSLAAFAVTYGEFLLVTQLHPPTNEPSAKHCGAMVQVARSVGLLKQLPDILGASTGSFQRQFDALNEVMKAIFIVVNCMLNVNVLTQNNSPEISEISTAVAYFPIPVYWCIRSVVVCINFISDLGCKSRGSLNFEFLSDLPTEMVSRTQKELERRRQETAHRMLVHLLKTPGIVNVMFIERLICSNDDQPPLIDCASKQRVNTETLREKNVLIMIISNQSISQEELEILKKMFQELQPADSGGYVTVWVPIASSNEEKHLQMTMYTVHQPLLPDVWKFEEQSILVVLDKQGKVVCHNAVHMLRIWKDKAIPFTRDREQELWNGQEWGLQLLLDAVDPLILEETDDKGLICLYGGGDKEWTTDFKNQLKNYAKEMDIEIKMVYVGKRNCRKEQLQKNLRTFNESQVWKEFKTIWFFWARVHSMLRSREQIVQTAEKDDDMLKEITTLLTFDSSEKGWALFGNKGISPIAIANGSTILNFLKKIDENRKEEVKKTKGLVAVLKENIRTAADHCSHIILEGHFSKIPFCAICNQPMEKYILYRCCQSIDEAK